MGSCVALCLGLWCVCDCGVCVCERVFCGDLLDAGVCVVSVGGWVLSAIDARACMHVSLLLECVWLVNVCEGVLYQIARNTTLSRLPTQGHPLHAVSCADSHSLSLPHRSSSRPSSSLPSPRRRSRLSAALASWPHKLFVLEPRPPVKSFEGCIKSVYL